MKFKREETFTSCW